MNTPPQTYKEITKVLIGIPGSLDLEPAQVRCFNAGYSLISDTKFPGEIKVLENDSFAYSLDYAQKYGFQMVMRPTGTFASLTSENYQLALRYYRDYGIQYICPAGSNQYRHNVYTTGLINPIITGAGEVGNATGYGVEFYGKDVVFGPDVILRMRQEGTVYPIEYIKRISSSLISVKLTGITDVTTIGFDDHGIPCTFSGVTGTDISPLPNGVKYTTFAGGSEIHITHTTTAGTIGNFQAVTGGNLMFGLSANNVYIRTTYWNLWNVGNVYLSGITGFQYLPNGNHQSGNYYNADGFGDKFSIVFNLGTGSGTLLGTAKVNTSSYGNPYVAGIIAALVNHHKVTIWQARYILRMTSSGGGVLNTYDGYGKVDVSAAKSYSGSFIADPYLNIGTIGTISGVHQSPEEIILTIPDVANATHLELYQNGVLIDTLASSGRSGVNFGKNITLTRKLYSEGKYYYKYRARMNTAQYTAFSNEISFKCFKTFRIAV